MTEFSFGKMVASRESAPPARRLIEATFRKQAIDCGQLTIHADRGSAMKSRLVAELLADHGVTETHSRPYVSDDNPFSESQLRTMKYRPEYPESFGSIQDACAHCTKLFKWYNEEHRHSGIGLQTPSDVHHRLA